MATITISVLHSLSTATGPPQVLLLVAAHCQKYTTGVLVYWVVPQGCSPPPPQGEAAGAIILLFKCMSCPFQCQGKEVDLCMPVPGNCTVLRRVGGGASSSCMQGKPTKVVFNFYFFSRDSRMAQENWKHTQSVQQNLVVWQLKW